MGAAGDPILMLDLRHLQVSPFQPFVARSQHHLLEARVDTLGRNCAAQAIFRYTRDGKRENTASP